ncbi:hypothetical protein [Roseiterribacter gracilis]
MTMAKTMRSALCFLAALVALTAHAADAPVVAAKPTDLTAIDVAPGFTTIPGFTPDNRPARVLKAWRENGNAYGYSIYLITTASGMGRSDWNIVPITVPTPWHVQDMLTDTPHTFEDMVRSVRFARGKIGGEESETLVFTATRDVKDDTPAPAQVAFELYRVVVTDEMGDVLERVRTWRSTKKYCNADTALLREVGLALPRDYEGGESEDGCGP